jgi:L-lysine 2,3-aminomutase
VHIAQVEQPEIRATPWNAKWCREKVVEIFLRRYSDLCQPNYVLDISGGHGKFLIVPTYLSTDRTEIIDFKGARHAYPPRLGG